MEAVDFSSATSRRPASEAEPDIDSDHLMEILEARGSLSDARQAWVSPPEVAPGATPNRMAQAILALVQRPTAEPLTVGAAARALRVTPRRLHRLSLRLFGHPPRVLFALARVDAISRSLRHSSSSLEQIAEENGFSDAGSMSRIFFRYVGIRPGAFRKGATAQLSDRAMTDRAMSVRVMSDHALEQRGKRA